MKELTSLKEVLDAYRSFRLDVLNGHVQVTKEEALLMNRIDEAIES